MGPGKAMRRAKIAAIGLACIALAACVLLASSNPTKAEGDIDGLLKAYDSKDPLEKQYARIHADLIETGISAANRAIVGKKQTPLYWPPSNLVLTGDQVLDMLRREVQKIPPLGTVATDLGILVVLERTFACNH